MVGLPDGDKNFEDMCNRLHTIPVCDGRMERRRDRQTSCNGIVRAMQQRRAVKTHEAQLPQTNCATMVNDPKNVAMFPAQIHCIFIF